jgi:hypothetical protein
MLTVGQQSVPDSQGMGMRVLVAGGQSGSALQVAVTRRATLGSSQTQLVPEVSENTACHKPVEESTATDWVFAVPPQLIVTTTPVQSVALPFTSTESTGCPDDP